MEVFKEKARTGTRFGQCLAAAVVGALALVAAPKAADALTLSFQDVATGTTIEVNDGDARDLFADQAGVISVAALRLGNFTIDAGTARSNALSGELPAYLNVNVTAFAEQAGRLIVRAWDYFTAGPADGVPAFFATSATLRNGSTAVSEAWVDGFQIGRFNLSDSADAGKRSTTVALGETFRIYQEFTIDATTGSVVNIDGFVEVIPVPAALPLMLGGLGMLGFLGWRRRSA